MTALIAVLRHYDYQTCRDVFFVVRLTDCSVRGNSKQRKRHCRSWRGDIIDGPMSEKQAHRAAQAQKRKGEK